MANQPTIFLSYARRDDPKFVTRLYAGLTAQGFDVWWDRVSMPSRGLMFNEEIRDAVDERDRLIEVIGPEAVKSPSVRQEWEYALSVCKIVNPILRIGNYSLLPEELAHFNCPDFTDDARFEQALAELARNLRQDVKPPASLHHVPDPPPHLIPRPDHLQTLRNTVMADALGPTVVTSARQTSALQGMSGIGKSVLAAAFARDCATRRAFYDGIVWIELRQQPSVLAALQKAGSAVEDDATRYTDLKRGTDLLRRALEDKTCLLVLDDVWRVDHAAPFRQAVGPRCRLLITTRDASLVTDLGAQAHRVDQLSDEAALDLLARWAGKPPPLTPEALGVARECGNLPLSLAQCGAWARDGVAWADLAEKLRAADLAFIKRELPGYPYPDAFKALEASLSFLEGREALSSQRYLELAVFPPAPIPEAAVATLWSQTGGLSEIDARKLVTELHNKGLIQRLEGESPARRLVLHDLHRDYVSAKLRAKAGSAGLSALHLDLLRAYQAKCSGGWHSGPPDGYFFERLPYHFCERGRNEELRSLLLDFDWLQAKLAATDITSLISDYDFASGTGRPGSPYGSGVSEAPDDAQTPDMLPGESIGIAPWRCVRPEQVSALSLPNPKPLSPDPLLLVQGALRLSAHVLERDKAQLPGQILGRLLWNHESQIDGLLLQTTQSRSSAWLEPEAATLTPAGGPLFRILAGHSSGVRAVAVTPDGKRAVSASYDQTLKVWDLSSGKELQTLAGHSSTVNVVAVFVSPDGDGKRAVSASDDHTLKVWDLSSGKELQTLAGHSSRVMAVAVTPDGKRAVSASYDQTLKVWDLSSGKELQTLAGHSSTVRAVAVTPDGKRAVSASDRTLKVWDLSSGKELQTLAGHSSVVTAVAVTPDGKRAVSASDDHTLKVWDLSSGKELQTLAGHSSGVTAVAVTPDGKRAVSASDRTLKVWDLSSGKELQTLAGHSSVVTAVAVTPDGKRAVSASDDHTLKVWDLSSGKQLQTLAGHSNGVMAVAVTPDGKRAVSASYDGAMKIWDLSSGKELRTLAGHSSAVSAVAGHGDGVLAVAVFVSPHGDAQLAVSASEDQTLKVWDLSSGQELQTLAGHSSAVMAVAVTPDGKRAVSASQDQTLKVWDLETGTVIASFTADASVGACAVARDGVSIVAGDQSGAVHFLRLVMPGE